MQPKLIARKRKTEVPGLIEDESTAQLQPHSICHPTSPNSSSNGTAAGSQCWNAAKESFQASRGAVKHMKAPKQEPFKEDFTRNWENLGH